MRYLPHSKSSIDIMLKAIGQSHLESLFDSIPEQARLERDLELPKAMGELALKAQLSSMFSSTNITSFLGAGACQHFVPEWISQQLLRCEWYTAYTPYQPEASQGTLQALFEFQTMIASLFGLDIANASMYDGATALVEALLMAVRIKNKKIVLLSKTIHPEYRQTAHTYLAKAGIEIIEIDSNSQGLTDLSALAKKLPGIKAAALAIQSPNFFGQIEDVKAAFDLIHSYDGLAIGSITDMSSTAILSSMGKSGADIAVGEGLGLVGGLNCGGPGLGLFSCRKQFLRQIPGRLVGQTTDSSGQIGYTLTLSTREQHIRREKASSNICTNHNLTALAFAMAIASYGSIGFRKLAKINLKKTLYFRSCLKKNNIDVKFTNAYYNETVINLKQKKSLKKVVKLARKKNMIAGLALEQFYPELSAHILIATSELHSQQQIENLADILGDVYV